MKHQPFFITGLPRSRTTWLSALFTVEGVHCYHDLLGVVDDMAEFSAALNRQRSGDCDSGLLYALGLVQARWPAAPWVLVRRDFDQAWQSLHRFIGQSPWAKAIPCTERLRKEMHENWCRVSPILLADKRCLTVDYAALDRTETLGEIWAHCLPDIPWNPARAEWLQEFRIEMIPSKSTQRVPPSERLLQEIRQCQLERQ